MNIAKLNIASLDDKTFIIKRGTTINNQDKVVDITENGTVEIVPDTEFTGLSKVTANISVSNNSADVIFYDFDGTVLKEYTKEEFLLLNELPPLPTYDNGLICEEWNMTIEEIQTQLSEIGWADIGAICVTSDNCFHYIFEPTCECELECTLSNNLFRDGYIDWGDGYITEIPQRTSGIALRHSYSIGTFVIKINNGTNIDWLSYDDANNQTKFGSAASLFIKRVYAPKGYSPSIDGLMSIECITTTNNSVVIKGYHPHLKCLHIKNGQKVTFDYSSLESLSVFTSSPNGSVSMPIPGCVKRLKLYDSTVLSDVQYNVDIDKISMPISVFTALYGGLLYKYPSLFNHFEEIKDKQKITEDGKLIAYFGDVSTESFSDITSFEQNSLRYATGILHIPNQLLTVNKSALKSIQCRIVLGENPVTYNGDAYVTNGINEQVVVIPSPKALEAWFNSDVKGSYNPFGDRMVLWDANNRLIEKIEIPATISEIKRAALDFYSVNHLYIGNSVTSIASNALRLHNNYLCQLTLDNEATYNGNWYSGFSIKRSFLIEIKNGNNLYLPSHASYLRIYCSMTEPPTLMRNVSARKLIVPVTSVDKYSSATNWSNLQIYGVSDPVRITVQRNKKENLNSMGLTFEYIVDRGMTYQQAYDNNLIDNPVNWSKDGETINMSDIIEENAIHSV